MRVAVRKVLRNCHVWLKPIFEKGDLHSCVTSSMYFLADVLMVLDNRLGGKLIVANTWEQKCAKCLVEGRSRSPIGSLGFLYRPRPGGSRPARRKP